MAFLESASFLQIRSDVKCTPGWTYAFDMKCVHLYPNDTMSQATATCHKHLSDMGLPVDPTQSAVIFTVGGLQGNAQEVWFGHHIKNMDKFANKIPSCSENVGVEKDCVKLIVTVWWEGTCGYRSRCWAPEKCEMKLPFFCIGDAAMLRMNGVDQRPHYKAVSTF